MTTTSATTVTELLVHRTDPTDRVLRDRPLPAVRPGEVLVAVDWFALTANNATYAALGDAMSYWDFFPSGVDDRGVVPVWGFGTVLESAAPGVAAGERLYGFWPMASHAVLAPVKVREDGFTDGSAHREPLHALYNRYTCTATDPLHDSATEDVQLLLRPLFVTSFVLDDLLADQDFHGARTVVLSSASSKTALGTALRLSHRTGIRVVGLTSPGNAAFVRATGWYTDVLGYHEIEALPAGEPVVYLDFAGSGPVRRALHDHLDVRHDSVIGAAAGEYGSGAADLPGAAPTPFFAPAQIRKRNTDWGADGFALALAEAWRELVASVPHWLQVVPGHGPAAVAGVWDQVIAGAVPPDRGHVLTWASAE